MLTKTSLNRLSLENSYNLIAFYDIHHKSEPELRNGNIRISCSEFVTITEHVIANVCLYLCFQLRIMYVENML